MTTSEMMSIGEAASRSGVPAKTIRFYEDEGIIAPAPRRENRYRSYSQVDVQTLRFIHRARNLGFPLREVADLVALYRDPRRASGRVKRLALQHVAELDRKIAEMNAIRNAISHLAECCRGEDRPDCPVIDEFETAGR